MNSFEHTNETISNQIYSFWASGDFTWILFSLSVILVWFSYLTFYNSRVIGTILTFIIRRFTSYNVKIGSFSISVLGGKLMLRDLYIINKDYSFRSHFVVVKFNYWKAYDPDKKHDSKRTLKIYALKPEFHMFNRSQVYKDLKNVMFNVSETSRMLTMENIRYARKNTQNRHKTLNADYLDSRNADSNEETKSSGWDFNYQDLIPKIKFDLEVFTMCFGNHLLPTTFCLKSEKIYMNYSTCPSTYVVDEYKHLLKVSCKNFSASFVQTINFKGNRGHITDNTKNKNSQILFFGSSEFTLDIDEPGKVTLEPEIIQMTQGNIEVLRTYPKYALTVEVNQECQIAYDSWADSQRDILHKFFFPPDYQTMKIVPVPHAGMHRLHKQFDIYFKSLSNTEIDINFNDKQIQLTSNKTCTMNLVMPWLVSEDGYTCTLQLSLPNSTCLFNKHMCKDLFQAEQLDFSADFHYPRVWNAMHTWSLQFNFTHAKCYLLFDYKDYITELVDDWIGNVPGDLCKFIPYIYDIKLNLTHTKCILYANDYNWISQYDENAYMGFQVPKALIHITMPFIDFLPKNVNYGLMIDAEQVKCQLSLPETSTSLYIMKEFQQHIKLVNRHCKPTLKEQFNITTEYARERPSTKEKKQADKRRIVHWIDCVEAASIKIKLNYQYHSMHFVKNLWDFVNPDLCNYAKLTKLGTFPSQDDPLDYLRPESLHIYGPTADFLTKSHFDASFMDPDMLNLEVNVSSGVICLYGSLLRHVLHIKENYFGENRRLTNFDGKQLTAIEQAKEIKERVYSKEITDPRMFRPFAAKIKVTGHNVQGHLIKHCSNDATYCPTVFIDCIGFEMDKGHIETQLQVLVSPILVIVFDSGLNQSASPVTPSTPFSGNYCTDESSRPQEYQHEVPPNRHSKRCLGRGSIVIEAIQIRGHALFTDGIYEYAWILEATLGKIQGQLSAPQLNTLVHCAQSFIFLITDQENELKPARDFEFCQHLWPVSECPEWKYKSRHNCPRETDLKYKLLRVLFDGIQFNVIEPSHQNRVTTCLQLTVDGPVHLVNCNLHGPTTREGISAVLPRVAITQLIRPDSTSQPDTPTTAASSGNSNNNSNICWLQAGYMQLADLVLNAGIALPTPDSRQWQDHYLRHHDKPTRRLWFLWNDLECQKQKALSNQCGCVGGCYFFGENNLNLSYSRSVHEFNTSIEPKAAQFIPRDMLGKTRLLSFGESFFDRGQWVFETHDNAACCQISNGWILLRRDQERNELINAWYIENFGKTRQQIDSEEANVELDWAGVKTTTEDNDSNDSVSCDINLASRSSTSNRSSLLVRDKLLDDEIPILDEFSNASQSGGVSVGAGASNLRRKYSLSSLISCSKSSNDGVCTSDADFDENYERLLLRQDSLGERPRKSLRSNDSAGPHPEAYPEEDDDSSNERRAKHVDLRGQINRNISESYLLWSAYQRHLTKYQCNSYGCCGSIQKRHFWMRFYRDQLAKFQLLQDGFNPALIVMKKTNTSTNRTTSQYSKTHDPRGNIGMACTKRFRESDELSVDSTTKDLTAKTTVGLKLNQPLDVLLTPLFVECMTRYVAILSPELGQTFTSTVINRLHFQSVQLTLDRLKPTKGLQRESLETISVQTNRSDSSQGDIESAAGGGNNTHNATGELREAVQSWVSRTVSSVLNPLTGIAPEQIEMSPSKDHHHTVIQIEPPEESPEHLEDSPDGIVRQSLSNNNSQHKRASSDVDSMHATGNYDSGNITGRADSISTSVIGGNILGGGDALSGVVTETPFTTRISRTQMSLGIDRINVCIMQLYVIEDIVNADTLQSGLQDLTCVSLMSLCLDSACFQILVNTRNDCNDNDVITDTIPRTVPNQPPQRSQSLSAGGVQQNQQFRKTEDMIANIEVKRIHGQLRRLTRESQFSPSVLLTAIPFNSSKVFFAFDSDPGGALSKSVKLDERSAGWIMFECGLENLILKGIRKRGYPDNMDDYSKKQIPKPETGDGASEQTSQDHTNRVTTEINDIFEEIDENLDQGSSLPNGLHHQGGSPYSPSRNALISQLKVRTVWLNFPAPKKLPNKRRVDITRDDWNLLSTATPAIRAWMEPCHRLIYEVNKLKTSTERRQLAVLACLMSEISFGKFLFNKLIGLASGGNSYNQWRSNLAKDIYREPTCQAFTVMRMFLQNSPVSSPGSTKIQEIERSLKEDTLPQLDILQRGIFALTRHFQYVIVLDPQPNTIATAPFGPNVNANSSGLMSSSAAVPLQQHDQCIFDSRSHPTLEENIMCTSFIPANSISSPHILDSETNQVVGDNINEPLHSIETPVHFCLDQSSSGHLLGLGTNPLTASSSNKANSDSAAQERMIDFLDDAYTYMVNKKDHDGTVIINMNEKQPKPSLPQPQPPQPQPQPPNVNLTASEPAQSSKQQQQHNQNDSITSNKKFVTNQLNQANFLRMHYNHMEDAKRNFKPLLEIAGLHVRGIRRTTLMKKFGGFFSANGHLDTFKIDIIQSETNPLAQYSNSAQTKQQQQHKQPSSDVLCSLPDQRQFSLKRSPTHRSSTFRCQGFSTKIAMRDVIGYESKINTKNELMSYDSDIKPTTTQINICVGIQEIRQHIHMPLLRLVHQFVTMVYCAQDTQEEINQRRSLEWTGFSKRHQKHHSKGSSNDTVITGDTGANSSFGNRSQQDILHYSSLKSSTSASKTGHVDATMSCGAQPTEESANNTDTPECWKQMYMILDLNSRVPEMKTISVVGHENTGNSQQQRRSFALPNSFPNFPLINPVVNPNSATMPTIKEELNESNSVLYTPLGTAPHVQFIGSSPVQMRFKRQSSIGSNNTGQQNDAERTKLEIERFTYPWMKSERIPLVVFCAGKVKKMSLSAVLSELNLDGQLHNVHCSFVQTSRIKGRGMFTHKSCDQSFTLHSGEMSTTLNEELDSIKKLDVVQIKGRPSHIVLSSHKTKKLERNICFFSLGQFDFVLPHHPKKLKDVVERNAKRISSTVTEFLRPYHNMQQFYDATNSSSIGNLDRNSENMEITGNLPGGTNTTGGSLNQGLNPTSSLDNMTGPASLPGVNYSAANNRDYVDNKTHTTDNFVRKNKVPYKKKLVLNITGLSKGLTMQVALYHSTTAHYSLQPVYLSGSLYEDDFKLNVSLKNHSLTFVSMKPLQNLPPKMPINLPKIVMQIAKRDSQGGMFQINQGRLTQDLITEKGSYIDVLATISTLEHSVPIELLSYVMVTVQLFIQEINEVIQKMSGEVGAIGISTPRLTEADLNKSLSNTNADNKLWNRAARGNTKFSFRVSMDAIKLTATTKYGEVKLETHHIEVELANRIRSCNPSIDLSNERDGSAGGATNIGSNVNSAGGKSKRTMGPTTAKDKRRGDSVDTSLLTNNSELKETIFVFMLIKKIIAELGVTQTDELYVEKPPEFNSLASFTTSVSLRSLLTEEKLSRTSKPLDSKLDCNREDYLIQLLRPIVWVRPVAINRGVYIYKLFNEEFAECRRVLVPEAGSQSTVVTPSSVASFGTVTGRKPKPDALPNTPVAADKTVVFLQLSIEELGACMPLQSPTISSHSDTRGVHLVLTLEHARLTCCFKKDLVCTGEFLNFCFRFDESFNVGSTDWKPDIRNVINGGLHNHLYSSNYPPIVFNGCEVTNGTYCLKSRLPSKPINGAAATTNYNKDKMLIELDWNMRGLDSHLDWFIGKRLKELIAVVSGLMTASPSQHTINPSSAVSPGLIKSNIETAKFITCSQEELPTHRRLQLASRSNSSITPVSKILGYASPQPSRRHHKHHAHSHQHQSTPPVRPSSLKLMQQPSRASSEYFDAEQQFNYSREESNNIIYPDQFEDCLEESPENADGQDDDIQYYEDAENDDGFNSENTTFTQANNTLQPTAANTTNINANLALELKVNIRVDSGKCALHPKLPSNNNINNTNGGAGTSGNLNNTNNNSASSAALNMLPHNLTMTALEIDEDYQIQLRQRYHTYLQFPQMNSDISMFYIPAVHLDLLYKTNPTNVQDRTHEGKPKAADLYASILLKKLPKDLVLCPSLIDFVEQCLEIDPEPESFSVASPQSSSASSSNQNSPMTKRPRADDDNSSNNSLSTGPESLPVDVIVQVNIEPSTLRVLSITNATTITCMMGLPHVNLLFTSYRHEPTATASSSSNNLKEGGLSVTGVLNRFTIEVFRSHGSAGGTIPSSISASNRWNPRPTEMALHWNVEKIQVNLARLHQLTVSQEPVLSCHNNVKISAVAYIGAAQFKFDSRCVGDLMTFCTAWYRASLARRLLLGNEPGTNIVEVDTSTTAAPDVYPGVDKMSGGENTGQGTLNERYSSKSTSMRSSWSSLMILAVNLDELDIQMSMSNIIKAQLLIGQSQANGHICVKSNGRKNVQWRVNMRRARLLGLEGGMIGGDINQENLEVYLLRGEDDRCLLMLELKHWDWRVEYMGSNVLLGRLCAVDLRVRNNQDDNHQVTASLDWDQCQLTIGRNTLPDTERILVRCRGHFDDLWQGYSRSVLSSGLASTTTTAPLLHLGAGHSGVVGSTSSGGAGSGATAAGHSKIEQEAQEHANYMKKAFERHWQPVFQSFNPFTAGGSLRLCGSSFGCVFFVGSLRNSMEWAIFCVQNLDIGVETLCHQSQELTSKPLIDIHQSANFVLGRKHTTTTHHQTQPQHNQQLQTLSHCAFIIRANATKEPNPKLSPRTNEWLDYAFRPADISIVAYLQNNHNTPQNTANLYVRFTNFPESSTQSTVRQNPLYSLPVSGSILMAFPALDVIYQSTHKQLLGIPQQIDKCPDRYVDTSLVVDFHSFISCGISEVTWLPNLIGLYLTSHKPEPQNTTANVTSTSSSTATLQNPTTTSISTGSSASASNSAFTAITSSTNNISSTTSASASAGLVAGTAANSSVNQLPSHATNPEIEANPHLDEQFISIPQPDNSDQRIFHTKEFKVGPNLRILQANNFSMPPIDTLFKLFGINRGRVSVPKYVQRKLLDPLDNILAVTVLKVLQMKQDNDNQQTSDINQ